MRKSSGTKTRKVTPPSPTYMSNDQFVNYLSDLRSNRIARPGGARPLPASGGRATPARSSTSRYSIDSPSLPEPVGQASQQRLPSQAPSVAAASVSSRHSMSSSRGRDYYPASSAMPLKPSEVVPTATYMERGQRWMEKEEAFSLRDAMEQMDTRDGDKGNADDDDARLYDAALNEAAELVWQHQHGPKKLQPDGAYRYKPHLRKNSYAHARTASIGRYGDDIAPSGLSREPGSRSVSGSSTESSASSSGNRVSFDSAQLANNSTKPAKPYGSIGAGFKRRSSLKRNISGEVERPFSGDQIWEEPESAASNNAVFSGGRASPDKLSSMQQNPLNRTQNLDGTNDTIPPTKPLNRIEIHRNPPSQSRNAFYTSNNQQPTTPLEPEVECKNGVEIRGDDIRAATSFRLKDRSAKLPEPTAVSDSPGRPIVSFDTNWKPAEETTDPSPDLPSKTPLNTKSQPNQQPPQPMAMPCINISEVDPPRPRPTASASIPSISIAGCDGDPTEPHAPVINIPTIAVEDRSTKPNTPSVAIPIAKQPGGSRPLPAPSSSRPKASRVQMPRGHWSPAPGSIGRPATTCHECGFPIEGRFVALAGSQERFHPQCFSCFSCGTSLEAMEISPEPDLQRKARLERIRRRQTGEVLNEVPGMTMEEDGDERLRFYCHLDWHELFAPRCKHCKTPILGEHIVALGEHWHYGHFFCAECGDPFQHGMTHIEKDGYAWCIKCQTKRTERRAPKCKMCKTAVIGQYIQALGGEWHEHCFRCAQCQGGFVDGQIFPKEVKGSMIVLCTDCRTRDLKA